MLKSNYVFLPYDYVWFCIRSILRLYDHVGRPHARMCDSKGKIVFLCVIREID